MLAIDIGFSSCKCKAANKEWKFPSLAVPLGAQSVNLGEGPSGYLYKGRRYSVGASPVGAYGAKYVREIEFLFEFGPLFVAHAVKGMAVQPTVLAVGLPLGDFKRETRDRFREVLSRFTIDGREYSFEVRVFPQAVGALSQYAHESSASPDESGFLVDIGFNTAIVLRFMELKAKSEGSVQYNQFGISRALEELGAILKAEYGETYSPLELNEVFQKGVLVHCGKRIDMSATLKEVVSNHVDSLMKQIKDTYSRDLVRSDRLVMAGGGAYHINGQLPAEYRDFCKFLENPEFSNVRGYWRLAGGCYEQ